MLPVAAIRGMGPLPCLGKTSFGRTSRTRTSFCVFLRMFEEGHIYYGHVEAAGKRKYFVVVRNCETFSYIAFINTKIPPLPPTFGEEVRRFCFMPIEPRAISNPRECALAYDSWVSLYPKGGRTLPTMAHRSRDGFRHCGPLVSGQFQRLLEQIEACDLLKEKHKRRLLRRNEDC